MILAKYKNNIYRYIPDVSNIVTIHEEKAADFIQDKTINAYNRQRRQIWK